jgi:membrane associated rhomboid family serine protease
MSWFAEADNHRPMMYWKGHAIWLTTVVAIAGVVSMVFTALLAAISPATFSAVVFNTQTFLNGAVWSVITYPFLNPPDFWFVLTCYMLWQFGSSVERHLGRKSVALLMLANVLTLPLLCLLMRAFTVSSYSLFGLHGLYLGIFSAFATLYPNTQINIIIVSVSAWILAVVMVGISVLRHIMSHDMAGLLQTLLPVALSYFWVKYETGSLNLPQLPKRRPTPRKPVARGTPAVKLNTPEPMAQRYHREPSLDEQINAILDKISEKGMGSLAEAEKKLLERHSSIQQRRKER